MDIKKILPISEVRKNIFKITDKAQVPGVYFTLTEKGRPKAVIMSAEEFESWQETLEIMSIFPDLRKDAKEADKAVKKGSHKKMAKLEDVVDRYGNLLVDKKRKNGLVRKAGKKGGKGFR